MIISDQHKYLFIEVPHTGSSAISKELRELYAGEEVLRKHAHYAEFARVASPAEKKYFVFAGIRNPLDEAVTVYFKLKTDHKSNFSTESRHMVHGGAVTKAKLKRFRFVHDEGADFPTYFRKFYRQPYNNVSSISHRRCDFIIRFERLQEDFARALELIGIEAQRSLPQVNKTGSKKKDFTTYYPPEIREQAKRVFGPFMKKWGYEFPADWGPTELSIVDRVKSFSFDCVRNTYWRHIRWSPRFYGRLLRGFR